MRSAASLIEPVRAAVHVDPRLVDANDLQAGVSGFQLGFGDRRHARCAAQEVHTVAAFGGSLHQGQDQIGARDFLGQGSTQQARCPQHRGAVDQRQSGGCVRLPKAGVVLDHHHVVDIGREYGAALAGADQLIDRVQRTLEIDDVDG